jgi:PKHD-type hydroxylase
MLVLHVRQVLGAAELRQLRELAARAAWTDGRTTSGDPNESRKRNEQVDVASAEGQAAAQVVRDALRRHPLFAAVALPSRLSVPMFNRYTPGMQYGAHVDASIMGGGEPLRTDLSATLFVADPTAYDGGELIVESAQGQQAVKLPAGDLLLYPATSVHRVAPVTRGERVAVIFWVQSMVRDAAQRGLLLELSQAISNLEPTLGDSADFNRLTACYHNLVRMWAQP